jgi:hypothetical protein
VAEDACVHQLAHSRVDPGGHVFEPDSKSVRIHRQDCGQQTAADAQRCPELFACWAVDIATFALDVDQAVWGDGLQSGGGEHAKLDYCFENVQSGCFFGDQLPGEAGGHMGARHEAQQSQDVVEDCCTRCACLGCLGGAEVECGEGAEDGQHVGGEAAFEPSVEVLLLPFRDCRSDEAQPGLEIIGVAGVGQNLENLRGKPSVV